MNSKKRLISIKTITMGLALFGSLVALAACQSNTKDGGDVALSPSSAQDAYFECIRTDARGTVRGGTTDYDIATRFLNRCAGELAEWENALVASGASPERAAEVTDGVRDQLREIYMDNIRVI